MIAHYGIDPAHDVAVAAHELRHAVRALAESTDSGQITLAADTLDAVARALDRHWTAQRYSDERRAAQDDPRGEADR
jgi:hypothetical protein